MTPESEITWLDFFNRIVDNNSDFLQKLAKDNPCLTSSQFKVCAYLRTGHSTKEIANALALTKRSVENHRYRLRKLMKLTEKESLTAHLMKY